MEKSILFWPMSRPFPKARIRPQISTMPRQQTEATAHLNIYRLLVERDRLQQELQNLDDRRQQITSRLETLNARVAELEQAAQTLREQADQPVSTASNAKAISASTVRSDAVRADAASEEFDLLFLEY